MSSEPLGTELYGIHIQNSISSKHLWGLGWHDRKTEYKMDIYKKLVDLESNKLLEFSDRRLTFVTKLSNYQGSQLRRSKGHAQWILGGLQLVGCVSLESTLTSWAHMPPWWYSIIEHFRQIPNEACLLGSLLYF